MTYIVALTGGICSGKSTIAKEFIPLGVPLIDADIIAREIVAINTPALKKIKEHFGPKILNNNGVLNRTELRRIIFGNHHEKLWLNNLLHPLIYKETQYRLATVVAPYVLWISPLLIENRLFKQAQRILVVDVNPEVQLQRIIMRDGISRAEAESILAAQATRVQRLSYADDIIENNGQTEIISSHVISLHTCYLNISANLISK
ncbi:dephospho-CoA kinase [Candidatus Profftia sp. (ex Adelges kitamiensis)]|uniref:dephospho-CoA kinase n=1 Tax=Candidatus Profftia sp. (ex Adelges kitamiensis) TaxID=2864218 RepID=UPI001CE32432|nr:dephospho-CoA kinase [Candidatus Profftia sp. (ex Adelges kitamiensis)]